MVDRETVALQVCAFDRRILIGKLNKKNSGPYLQWRKALLLQKAEEGKIIAEGRGDRREQYLMQRGKLLEQKYALSRTKHKKTPSLTNTQTEKTPRTDSVEDLQKLEEGTQLEESTIIPVDKGSTEIYAFTGMHHIFVEHKKPVTNIRFANGDNDLLAFSSADGTLTIVHALITPSVIRVLKGHTDAITEFVWSPKNDYIITSSLDKSIKVWETKSGECIRSIDNESPCNCCCFHPIAENVFVVGSADGLVKVFSSTKMVFSVQVKESVNAIEFNDRGDLFFLGDNKGYIYLYRAGPKARIMQLIGKVQASTEPIVSLEFKDWFSDQINMQLLLVNCKDNNVKLLRVETTAKGMTLKLDKKFTLRSRSKVVRSCFCPSLSNKNRLSVASGSEEGIVYILDFKRKQHSINQLQGHGSCVHDVCWNDDETLLASCDSDGMVILWKRVKTLQTEQHDAARKSSNSNSFDQKKSSFDNLVALQNSNMNRSDSESELKQAASDANLEPPKTMGTKLGPQLAQYFAIPESEDLITYFSCALYRKFLIQGYMYITMNHLCFYAHLLGKKTKEVIAFKDIATIEKKKQAMVMATAIEVKMMDGSKYWFSNFIHRDSAWEVMYNQMMKCKQANKPSK